ncbi:glycosyltransferase [Massilia sp. YIM B02763]|uniref:glycosyltransferase family 2 protein n=1 Tax=Massilia sp. YIM B02763 TaxID=3050130 RepID=UPI0025B69D74|nr:glycosyltransferase [Massilia sp. YIM B02763]MDN4052562.1 glycosyltransferase [Massilia sp. YIM B02763]
MATFDVLMPVKNGLPYLREAIDSIRRQTWTDWRMFLVDHGSTDGSLDVAFRAAEADKRIVVVQCPAGHGFSRLLNDGLARCDARYVLRQDADDVSLPHRMQVLAAAFEADPGIVLLGSQGHVIDGAGRDTGRFGMPLAPERIAALSFFRIPVLHPAAAMRLDRLVHLGATYGHDFVKAVPDAERLEVSGLAEDYFLFGQLALVARCRNVRERLLQFRWHDNNISSRKHVEQTRVAIAISRYLARTFALLKDVPAFDPAPMCNHGYRLVDIRGRDRFDREFDTLRDSLSRGLGASAALDAELDFRRCFVRRQSAAMMGRYLRHAARRGTDRSEWYTVKSWLLHRSGVAGRASGAPALVAID